MSRPLHARVVPVALCALAALTSVAGCASLWNTSSNDSLASRPAPPSGKMGVRPASADEPVEKSEGLSWSDFSFENIGKTTKKLTGRGPNREEAIRRYREADDLFRQALAAPPQRKVHIFEMAAPKF